MEIFVNSGVVTIRLFDNPFVLLFNLADVAIVILDALG